MDERPKDWHRIDDEEEFRAAFTNATIVAASSFGPSGSPFADIFWHLSDGTWIAREISTSVGCDTCGYGANEKTYWRSAPSSTGRDANGE